MFLRCVRLMSLLGADRFLFSFPTLVFSSSSLHPTTTRSQPELASYASGDVREHTDIRKEGDITLHMLFVLAFDPFGILQGLADVLTGFVTGLLNLISQGILALNVLWSFIQNMPLAYTTQNPIIIQSWRTMTVIADGLLGLFLVVGTVQILYGQSTRSLEMPLPQFLGRAILTALLIHLSALLGETVLTLNNAISDVVAATLGNVITQLNGGALFSTNQTALFAAILVLVFAIGLLRLAMQGIKRIILFNLLFVLSGPAFLLSFHPSTQPVFAAWARLHSDGRARALLSRLFAPASAPQVTPEQVQQELRVRLALLQKALRQLDVRVTLLDDRAVLRTMAACLVPGITAPDFATQTPSTNAPRPSWQQRISGVHGIFASRRSHAQASLEVHRLPLADLLAPSSVTLSPDVIEVQVHDQRRYVRYVEVTAFAPDLHCGWQEDLTNLALPLLVMSRYQPLDSRAMIKRLEMQLSKLESQKLADRKALRLTKSDQTIEVEQVNASDVAGTLRAGGLPLSRSDQRAL